MSKLFAISDLHLSHAENRRALAQVASRPNDWLIVAGDVGETLANLEFAYKELTPRFRQLVWVPGNHDLWTLPKRGGQLRGEYKYQQLVALCRSYNVLTPEDPYPVPSIGGRPTRIAPLFLLYDYSFCPLDICREEAIAWAGNDGVLCADEMMLYADPYPGVSEWCEARCRWTETRLESCRDGLPVVLVNHFPLRADLAWLPRYPRFLIWCGTRRTEDWHLRFNAMVVVSGHLHSRSTTHRDGVRFEEVSLGYPHQWNTTADINEYIREILPA